MRTYLCKALLGCSILAAAGAQAATTITVASFPSHDAQVKAWLPGFKKAHPEIEVKLMSLAFADHHTAMTTALATGAGLPDVMAIEIGYIGKFAESGGLEDLSKPPYSALQYQSKFARFSFPQATSVNGALMAIPTDIGPGTLFYRKDIIEKAGVTEADLSKSWEGFVEAGKKIKASTGAYLLANAKDIKDIYIRTGLKDGEGIYFDKKNNVLVDSPRFHKAFELAKAVRVAGVDANIPPWGNEWSEGFRRDKIATQMMGSWLASHFATWLDPDHKGKWRSAQLPGGSFAPFGGSFFAIPSKSANKQAAWEFIKYATMNKDAQLEALRLVDAFPALIEAQNDPFIEMPIEYLGGQNARKLWKIAANNIPAVKVNRYDATAQDIVDTELNNVMERGKDINQALADAKALIQRRARR
ncbi:ABC transporter substrate-binding protein [Uliginosibacterium gangwonense]|uniref:ABC transporter substrate-binding protein n=1 Tax=Uliginosibacterium gangwonense TaxID=392736 RepID=UPI0003A4CA81|nr:extracellular solute-binding protein [Uliginosibacterium gangwonense]